jgi:hypothetical protein
MTADSTWERRGAHMFGSEVEPEIRFLPWLAQQIAAPALPLMWALLTASVPPALGTYAGTYVGQPLEIAIEILWSFVIGWGFAFALALAVRRVFPSASRSGKCVWVLPLLMLTAGFIWDCTLFPFRQAISEVLYYGAEGEASLGFFLITFPTCSCIIYSLAMYLADRMVRAKNIGGTQPCVG